MDQLHDLAPSRPPPPPPIKTRLNGWSAFSHYVSIPDQSSPRSEGDGLLSPGSSCRSALSPTVMYSPFASSFNSKNNNNNLNNLPAYNDRASPREPPPLSPVDLSRPTPFAAPKPVPPVSHKPAAKSVVTRPSQVSKLATKPYKDEPEPNTSTTMTAEYDVDDDEEEEEEQEGTIAQDDDDEIPELPPLIIITGATTGLGLAFFEHFSSCPPPPPPPPPSSSSESTTNLAPLPYDVIGIDKVPWRLPGQGFQWQTKIGTRGQYVQVDTTASAKRLDAWAEKWLYASVPAPMRPRPHSNASGSATQKEKKRYPRPVSLVLHCAEARGLVPEVEQQQLQQIQREQQKQSKKTNNPPTSSTTTTNTSISISLSPTAAETLDVMTAETMRRTYDANVIGTLQLAQTVIPHMQLHAQFSQARTQDLLVDATEAGMLGSTPLPVERPPRLVMLGGGGGGGGGGSGKARQGEKENATQSNKGSSTKMMMGSIRANISGGGYAYRASKAALNAVVKSLSVDVPEVCFASVLTGLADTSKKSGEEEDVVKNLLPMIEKLGTGSLTSGCFVDRSGESMDW